MTDFPDVVVERVAFAIANYDMKKLDLPELNAENPFRFEEDRQEFLGMAKAALAAAWEWVKAEDAPVEWEGREVWIYEPWTITKIRKGILPFSYSRLPLHCTGAMVMLSITPPPPEASDD